MINNIMHTKKAIKDHIQKSLDILEVEGYTVTVDHSKEYECFAIAIHTDWMKYVSSGSLNLGINREYKHRCEHLAMNAALFIEDLEHRTAQTMIDNINTPPINRASK